jgi:hypothetical protein
VGLDYLIKHDFQFCPFSSKWQDFILLNGWIMFHCELHFIHSLIDGDYLIYSLLTFLFNFWHFPIFFKCLASADKWRAGMLSLWCPLQHKSCYIKILALKGCDSTHSYKDRCQWEKKTQDWGRVMATNLTTTWPFFHLSNKAKNLHHVNIHFIFKCWRKVYKL